MPPHTSPTLPININMPGEQFGANTSDGLPQIVNSAPLVESFPESLIRDRRTATRQGMVILAEEFDEAVVASPLLQEFRSAKKLFTAEALTEIPNEVHHEDFLAMAWDSTWTDFAGLYVGMLRTALDRIGNPSVLELTPDLLPVEESIEDFISYMQHPLFLEPLTPEALTAGLKAVAEIITTSEKAVEPLGWFVKKPDGYLLVSWVE